MLKFCNKKSSPHSFWGRWWSLLYGKLKITILDLSINFLSFFFHHPLEKHLETGFYLNIKLIKCRDFWHDPILHSLYPMNIFSFCVLYWHWGCEWAESLCVFGLWKTLKDVSLLKCCGLEGAVVEVFKGFNYPWKQNYWEFTGIFAFCQKLSEVFCFVRR